MFTLVGCESTSTQSQHLATPSATEPLHSGSPTDGMTQGGTPEFVEYEGLIAELEEWERKTPLPDGASIVRPVDPGPYPIDDQGNLGVDVWQVGFGQLLVEEGAFCLWTKVWLDSRGTDSETAASALTQMRAFLDSDTFKIAYDPESAQPVIEDAVTKAELGDPAPAAQNWDLNCDAYAG